jgi:hypothetical protein
VLGDALAAVTAIESNWFRAEALTAFAPHLPQPRRATVLAAARDAARVSEASGERAWAFADPAPHLPVAEHVAVPHDALAAATAIEDTGSRAAALPRLAPHLSEPLLRDALAAASAIEDTKSRAAALAALAPHLSESLLRDALAAASRSRTPRAALRPSPPSPRTCPTCFTSMVWHPSLWARTSWTVRSFLTWWLIFFRSSPDLRDRLASVRYGVRCLRPQHGFHKAIRDALYQ